MKRTYNKPEMAVLTFESGNIMQVSGNYINTGRPGYGNAGDAAGKYNDLWDDEWEQ